jgi:putative endonuclease
MADDPRRRLGALGESLAVRHLEARGYEVIDRNFRTRHGELDIVAGDRRCLLFCEVKTRIASGRADPFGPFASLGPRKRRQVRAMARQWLMAHASTERPRPAQLRFDAIGVIVDEAGRLLELEHLEGAFYAELSIASCW